MRCRRELATLLNQAPGRDLGFEGQAPWIEYLPAYSRYQGKMYKRATFEECYSARASCEVVIISALYGMLDASDPIRWYELAMDHKLQTGGTVGMWWKDRGLGDIVAEFVRAYSPRETHDLLAISYRKVLGDWPPTDTNISIVVHNYPGQGSGSQYSRGVDLRELLRCDNNMHEYSQDKLNDIIRFYALMERLESCVGGKRMLATCDGRMDWPPRGVYFFFEDREVRSTSGVGPRVVRVGTHALSCGSRRTLWQRLREHRGPLREKYADGGNHRASIFRLHVGTAIINRDEMHGEGVESWGIGNSGTEFREAEHWIEKMVSDHIREMPFLWLDVDDDPGPESLRAHIERNVIALLSNYPHVGSSDESTKCIDPPSTQWLGGWAKSDRVRKSGLWNANHVDKDYDHDSLDTLGSIINGL